MSAQPQDAQDIRIQVFVQGETTNSFQIICKDSIRRKNKQAHPPHHLDKKKITPLHFFTKLTQLVTYFC